MLDRILTLIYYFVLPLYIESDEELESSQQALYKKMLLQEKKIKQEEKTSPFDKSEKNVIGKKRALKK